MAFLVLALFGTGLFSDQDPVPLDVTQVELVDGTNFDAAQSTAPVVPNEGPSEMAPKAETDVQPVDLATPDQTIDVPEMPILVATNTPPPKRPDFSNLQLPPPPTVVPTEPSRPSIALIPSLDEAPRQAEQPESPPATEPLPAQASAPTQDTAPKPLPPREAEPVAADEPQPKPEEPKQEPEPEAVVEAQPEAPLSSAPQEARLPVARPAEIVKAAPPSGPTEPVPTAATPPDEPKPAKPSGGSTVQLANAISVGEKDALRLGIKQHFFYNGNRSDRTLQVTIGIQLGQDARIIGEPELIRASGGDATTQRVLLAAGRRALFKAQNAGEFKKLPPAKYDGWKLIHVTFTPEEIGFSS